MAVAQVIIMQGAKFKEHIKCHDSVLGDPQGLALITIGNSLRGDDGIASALCDALPSAATADACRFDLGSYTGHLADCLPGHSAAIIIDATRNGTAPGTVSLADLGASSDITSPLNIRSCHGFSLADELRLAKRLSQLPERIVFFGVEVSNVDWSDKVTPTLEKILPQLVNKLSVLVSQMQETLKRDA